MNDGDTIEALFARYGPAYRYLVSFTTMIGTIATILSSTIVNVALPDVMGAFGIGQDHAQLLSTGFLAAVTGTMLMNAWCVERFGYRATYAGAVVVFVIGSLASGFAPSVWLLILGRVLQGGAAGLLQPMSMQLVFQVFPPEKRGSAMGLFAVGVVLAPALGPTIGGVLVDGHGWRSVFFLSLPFALLGVVMGMFFLPGRRPDAGRPRFDWIGAALMCVALLAFFTGLSSGQRHGWNSDQVMVELSVAAAASVAFIGWEMLVPAPLLNPRLFANQGFSAAFVVALLYGAGIFGTTYLLPLFVQVVQGYTPTRSGLVLMPAGLALVLVFPIAGRLADRLPSVIPVTIGLALFAASCALMVQVHTDTSFWTLALWILVGRVGLGLAMPSMNAGALRALPPRFLGQGAGSINFARQFGGALGVNGLSITLERHMAAHITALTASQDPGNPQTIEWLRLMEGTLRQYGVPEVERLDAAYELLGRVITAQAGMLGFRDAFLTVAVAFALAVLPALLLRGQGRVARG